MMTKSPIKINAITEITHPQGVFAYDKENEGKGAKNREVA
jgi:hypothetical protein